MSGHFAAQSGHEYSSAAHCFEFVSADNRGLLLDRPFGSR